MYAVFVRSTVICVFILKKFALMSRYEGLGALVDPKSLALRELCIRT